ncbi:MAG TPA: hypothetical protein VMM35_03335 [Longimicrobiales bacterium]|nr:hypothetical protein [Longimicrobiales bacterium]
MMSVPTNSLLDRVSWWASRLGPWVATAALAVWVSAPSGALLVIASAGVAAGALTSGTARRAAWQAGLALLVLTVVLGFVGHHQVQSLTAGWDL